MIHATSPSCCAGLRPTLLQGWRQGLPLHSSPFREMAASSGTTPRELIRTCAELQQNGSLQPIHALWGDALQRVRCRLFFHCADEALIDALVALPGCLRIERCFAEGDPPWLWAEMETLSDVALQIQLNRLPALPTAKLRLSVAPDAAAGPCNDSQLAAYLELGLPLCANPYVACARSFGRSERSLLITLMKWRRAGELKGMVLTPAPSRGVRAGWIALWHQMPALRKHPGLERLIRAPQGADWPWPMSAVITSASLPAYLPAGSRCLRLHVQQARESALLFQTPW